MNEFRIKVAELLDNGGVKGYNTALRSICKALPHALGEIIYKAVRYHAKHDLRDLVKIAAWAELEWESANANRAGSIAGNRARTEYARAFDEAAVARITDTHQRMFGGDTGSSRRGETASSVFPLFDKDVHVKGRTGAGGGRSRAVGGKHRRAARKGKP